jgi:hypothetical protein
LIISPTENYSRLPGSSVVFECLTNGVNSPTVTWYKGMPYSQSPFNFMYIGLAEIRCPYLVALWSKKKFSLNMLNAFLLGQYIFWAYYWKIWSISIQGLKRYYIFYNRQFTDSSNIRVITNYHTIII